MGPPSYAGRNPSRPFARGGKTYATATLKKDTITFDLTAINAKVNHATPTFDKATCSGSITQSLRHLGTKIVGVPDRVGQLLAWVRS